MPDVAPSEVDRGGENAGAGVVVFSPNAGAPVAAVALVLSLPSKEIDGSVGETMECPETILKESSC